MPINTSRLVTEFGTGAREVIDALEVAKWKTSSAYGHQLYFREGEHELWVTALGTNGLDSRMCIDEVVELAFVNLALGRDLRFKDDLLEKINNFTESIKPDGQGYRPSFRLLLDVAMMHQNVSYENTKKLLEIFEGAITDQMKNVISAIRRAKWETYEAVVQMLEDRNVLLQYYDRLAAVVSLNRKDSVSIGPGQYMLADLAARAVENAVVEKLLGLDLAQELRKEDKGIEQGVAWAVTVIDDSAKRIRDWGANYRGLINELNKIIYHPFDFLNDFLVSHQRP